MLTIMFTIPVNTNTAIVIVTIIIHTDMRREKQTTAFTHMPICIKSLNIHIRTRRKYTTGIVTRRMT